MRPMLRREEVEFFLRLHGLWEGVVRLPRPPPPPFGIESLQRIDPPRRAIQEWIAAAPLWQSRLQRWARDPHDFRPKAIADYILKKLGAVLTTQAERKGSRRRRPPLFPLLRSGQTLFQMPSPQKQISSISSSTSAISEKYLAVRFGGPVFCRRSPREIR